MVPGKGEDVGGGVGETGNELGVIKRGVEVEAGIMVNTDTGAPEGSLLGAELNQNMMNVAKRRNPASNKLARITLKLKIFFMIIMDASFIVVIMENIS